MKNYSWQVGEKKIKATQHELKLRQHLKLVPLLLGAEAGSLEELKDVSALLGIISNPHIFYDALRIILDNNLSDKILGEIPDSLIWEILEDFLSFNPRLKKSLGNLLSVISALLMKVMAPDSTSPLPSSESSLPSQRETSAKKSLPKK